MINFKKVDPKLIDLFMDQSIYIFDCLDEKDIKIIQESLNIKIEHEIKKENIINLCEFYNQNYKSKSRLVLKFNDNLPFSSLLVSEKENTKLIQDLILIISKNMNNEIELLPGSGSLEITLSNEIRLKSKDFDDERMIIWKNFAESLEIIPRTLIQNSNSKIDLMMKTLKNENGRLGIGSQGNLTEQISFDLYSTKLASLQYSFEIFQSLFEIDFILMNKDTK